MSPFVIVLGAALIDIGANMAINRSNGFSLQGVGIPGDHAGTRRLYPALGSGKWRPD